ASWRPALVLLALVGVWWFVAWRELVPAYLVPSPRRGVGHDGRRLGDAARAHVGDDDGDRRRVRPRGGDRGRDGRGARLLAHRGEVAVPAHPLRPGHPQDRDRPDPRRLVRVWRDAEDRPRGAHRVLPRGRLGRGRPAVDRPRAAG